MIDVKNKSDLDDAVDRIPYNGKGTNTGKALREVVRNAFVARNGDRPDVQNQVSTMMTETRFKTDTWKSLCDWLALSDTIFEWLRAPSS